MPLSHGLSHDDLALSVPARHQCSLTQRLFLDELHGPRRPSSVIEFIKPVLHSAMDGALSANKDLSASKHSCRDILCRKM